eukprot:jgi/Botrbrau1/7129/Bobra.0143s0009.1
MNVPAVSSDLSEESLSTNREGHMPADGTDTNFALEGLTQALEPFECLPPAVENGAQTDEALACFLPEFPNLDEVDNLGLEKMIEEAERYLEALEAEDERFMQLIMEAREEIREETKRLMRQEYKVEIQAIMDEPGLFQAPFLKFLKSLCWL